MNTDLSSDRFRSKPRASVSVIIPCFRCGDTIARAVKSVYQQTMIPQEVILVDDGSGDETLSLLYELQAQYSSHWIQVVELPGNRGPSAARNEGWNNALSDYVAFLDADDCWHPQKIKIQYLWMQAHPSVELTGHRMTLFSPAGQEVIDSSGISVFQVTKTKFLFKNIFSTPTVMIRADLKLRFDEDQRYAEDYLMWLSITYTSNAVFCIDANLAYMYKAAYGVSGLSKQLYLMEKGELRTYKKIFQAGHINFIQYCLFYGYSVAKFLRRVVLRCIGTHGDK